MRVETPLHPQDGAGVNWQCIHVVGHTMLILAEQDKMDKDLSPLKGGVQREGNDGELRGMSSGLVGVVESRLDKCCTRLQHANICWKELGTSTLGG